MPCPCHPPWLDHSNYAWRRVLVMKILIMQFYYSSAQAQINFNSLDN
jgi:hypothetical protein